MSILELIKTEGAEKVILELTKEIAKKDTYIAQLEKQVVEFRAMQSALGNVPVAPIVEKKARAKKTAKVSKLNLQTAVKKIFSVKRIKPEAPIYTIVVQNGVAYVTNLSEYLIWNTDKADGCYDVSTFIISGNMVEDYKHIASKVPQPPIIVAQGEINDFNGQVFANVSEVCSDDESRYFLTGVYIDTEAQKIVATDGRRLVTANVNSKFTGSNSVANPVVPVKNKDIITHSNSCVYSDKWTKFDGDGFTYYVENIECQYPNYKRVIPSYDATPLVVSVPNANQWEAIKTTDKIRKADGYINRLRKVVLEVANTVVDYHTASSKDTRPDVTSTFELSCSNEKIALNIDHLMDATVFGIDKLSGNNPNKSIIGHNEGYTYVVMPMQLD
jgi:hypothetical protein